MQLYGCCACENRMWDMSVLEIRSFVIELFCIAHAWHCDLLYHTTGQISEVIPHLRSLAAFIAIRSSAKCLLLVQAHVLIYDLKWYSTLHRYILQCNTCELIIYSCYV